MSDLQKHSERELAEMLQRGNASVMGELYARYARHLTGVCSRYVIDYEDTRDVLQESFIKIFTKGSKLQIQRGRLTESMAKTDCSERVIDLPEKERTNKAWWSLTRG